MHELNTMLAYAERSEGSARQMVAMLQYTAAVVGTGLAAIVPLIIARRRIERRMDGLVAGVVFWWFMAAGSLVWSISETAQWSAEYARLVASGYFDPRDTSAAPGRPWGLWVLLGAAYAGLLISAWLRGRVKSAGREVPPTNDRRE